MQLKKYYLIECVLCFMRSPCISFVHTPCLPCICSFCSFALLFVRSPDLCLFNHQFAFSLFIHSFAFSFCWVTRSPVLFFFLLTRFLSLSLTHSFLFSFILFVSVTRSLSPFFTHSFVFSCFLWLPRSFVQFFAVNISLYLSSFFFFFFLSPTGRSLFSWFVDMPFRSPLRRFLVSWPPLPLPYPLPLKFFLFFCPSVLSSLPICYFFVLNSQRNVSHFNPSKGCFIEKIFYKTVYSSYVVHETAFRVFFLSHLYCRRKEILHWWSFPQLTKKLTRTNYTHSHPLVQSVCFFSPINWSNYPGPWERDRLIFFLGAVMTNHSRLQVFKFVLSVVNDDVIDIK